MRVSSRSPPSSSDSNNLQTGQMAFNRRSHMTGLPQNYTRASRKICDVKRPARLGSSLLTFPFEPKPSFSRRVLAVAARLRRATNEAIAATLAEQAEHAV